MDKVVTFQSKSFIIFAVRAVKDSCLQLAKASLIVLYTLAFSYSDLIGLFVLYLFSLFFFSFSIFCSGCCSMGRLVLNVACLVVALSVIAQLGSAQLRQNYYANICPNVESIVRGAVTTKFRQTFVTAPATLRLFFHDCFVEVNERNGTWVRLIRVF